MTRGYRYPWTVAFGTFPPQEFVSAQQCWSYLDARFEKHKRGCFKVDGPRGEWADFYTLELWYAIAADADEFAGYYAMVARDERCG
jgi:hypothetical protein